MHDILTVFRTNVNIQKDIPFDPKERPHRPGAALVHCNVCRHELKDWSQSLLLLPIAQFHLCIVSQVVRGATNIFS